MSFIRLHLANSFAFGITEKFGFNGTTTTSTITLSNGVLSFTCSTYSLELVIEEEGRQTCTVNDDGDVSSYQSFWSWLETGKEKHALLLEIDDWSYNSIWTITRLASKELVLLHETVSTSSNYTETEKVVLTFEAK